MASMRMSQRLLPARCLPSCPSPFPPSSTRLPRERGSLKPDPSDFTTSRVPRYRSCGECRFPSQTTAAANQCNRKVGQPVQPEGRPCEAPPTTSTDTVLFLLPSLSKPGRECETCGAQTSSAVVRSLATCSLSFEQRAKGATSRFTRLDLQVGVGGLLPACLKVHARPIRGRSSAGC